jgi:hypothetical protein
LPLRVPYEFLKPVLHVKWFTEGEICAIVPEAIVWA